MEFGFKKVKCSSFLTKVKDGRYIELSHDENGNIDSAWYVFGCKDGKAIQKEVPESEYVEGEGGITKTYYREVKKKFNGVVVGYKDIYMNGLIYLDTELDYKYSEHVVIKKYKFNLVRCAIVYYADNLKHYVPINSITEEVMI